MKILLIAFVFYLNPNTNKLELMWKDTIPQESMEKCRATGDRYKYLHEVSTQIEVQYFCVKG